MALTVTVTPGKVWADNEVITGAKLNQTANPLVNLSGSVSTLAIADGSVTTPKLVDGVLSADATGRAKMADQFVSTAKLQPGALSADATGQAVMAAGYLLPTHSPTPAVLGTTGAVNVDWSLNGVFRSTLTANATLSFSNAKDGQSILIAVQQAAGGGLTLTWPGGILWGGAGAPTLTVTASKTDFFVILFLFGNYYGFYRQAF